MTRSTPTMTIERARQIAASFDLRALPADFYANPYLVYDALREHEPIRKMPDGSYFLTRYADLVAVYRDAQTFSSDKKVEFGPKYQIDSPLFEHHTTSLVFNDPPRHSRVRKLIMGALARRSIDAMQPALISLVDGLLDKLESIGSGDLIEDFSAAIPVEVIGNLLGVPHADRAPLRGWSLAILGALEPNLSADQELAGNLAVTQFSSYLRDLIEDRRKRPGDAQHDVLTRLIQGEGKGEAEGEALNESELVQNCIFILNAGHETTTNLIGNAMVALQAWPAQKSQLLTKIKQQAPDSESLALDLDLAVDEFLRFESSNQLGNRRALKDCTVGGVELPKGALITLCIGAANRDPAQFSDPNTLNLSRGDARTGAAPNRHLAFGFGIHQCAGLSLARLEGRIAIGRFLSRFPSYWLTAPPTRGGRARFRGFLAAPFVANIQS